MLYLYPVYETTSMSLKKHIPNTFTSLNLFSGCLGIVQVFDNNFTLAAIFMLIAVVCDFADGMLARLLNAKSPLGLQLDSLADVVSFGVLPGLIVMKLMSQSVDIPQCHIAKTNLCQFLALVIPVFSALRLAKFNIDTRQTDSFLGLPTPANAIFFGSLPLIIQQSLNNDSYAGAAAFLSSWWVLAALTLIFSALLVSEIPLFSFKFKNLAWKSNQVRYIMVVASFLLIIFFRFVAIPLIIVLYILLSLITGKVKSSIPGE